MGSRRPVSLFPLPYASLMLRLYFSGPCHTLFLPFTSSVYLSVLCLLHPPSQGNSPARPAALTDKPPPPSP